MTYNSGPTLEQCILSVLNQTYKNIEYIVVDGGSTDGTLDLIRKYDQRLTKWISGKDKGLYDALNKGISMATGDAIAILHSDDFYTGNNVLERYADLFEKTGCDAVYSDLYYVKKDDTDKIVRRWKSGVFHKKSFRRGWMPPHPTFVATLDCYKKFGAFDLAFKTAADYELMLRFIEKNKIRLAYLRDFTIKMRVGGKSNVSMKNRLNANLEDRKAWERNGLTPAFYTLYLKPIRKILQFI